MGLIYADSAGGAEGEVPKSAIADCLFNASLLG